MRISIRDVARHADVSPKTVTNVLRGRTARTSPQTRERVEQAIAELNYIPVRAASQNRHVETRIIGLVFDHMDAVRSFLGAETYLGLRDGALEHGYDLLTVLQTRPQWAKQRPEAVFLDRRCDGYIFVNPHKRLAVLKALVKNHVPTVCCYNTEVPAGIGSVTLDNHGAMEAAVKHLVAKGHRRIVRMGWDPAHSEVKERAAAFTAAMRQAGLNDYASRVVLGIDALGHYTPLALDEILRAKATAVVCDTTTLAEALREDARQRKIVVPRQLSLTGIDDDKDSPHSGITAATFSAHEIGYAAIKLLLSIMAEPAKAAPLVVPVHLVSRKSVAVPRDSPMARPGDEITRK